MDKHKPKKEKKQICCNSLYRQALKVARDHSLEELYDATGLPISYLRKFRSGYIESPSVHRVETILMRMTGEAKAESE